MTYIRTAKSLNPDRDKVKKLVEEYKTEFIEQGWNKSQATSLAWAAYYENHSMAYFHGWSMEFHASCMDCGEHKVFRCADTVRLFIMGHKNHKTVTRKVS